MPADLFIGMIVSGTGFAANTTINAIAGNVLTLSLAPTAGTNIQTVFTPPSIAASTTTTGSTAVTLGSAAPAGIVVGMAVGGPNIPGGTTVAAISGTSLTLSQPAIATGAANATITIGAPSNTYTGGTINNGGSGIFGALSLNGLPGSVVIPGDLTIGNSGVTMVTNQGQIASTSNVTWVSGGTLTLVGTNTLNSLTFNGNGTSGGSGTAAVGTLLNLSAANAITSINNDLGHTPTISGTALALTNAAPVINTSGLSPDSLIISAPITAAGGRILKQGTGSVVLSGAGTFTTGFDLQAGSIIFGAASVGTPPSITSGPLGTGSLQLSGGTAGSTILSDGNVRIIGNAVSVTGGGFTFGGTLAGNSTTLSGIVTLGAGANSINVTSPLVTGTITGQLTGGTNLTKTGNGILTLSSATNNYGGTTTISGGVLKVGAAGAIPDASAVTVNAGAVIDLNAFDETIGSLAGAGLATNSGAAKTLTVGSNDTNTTFSGSIATANVHLTKTGAGTLTLTGNNTIGNVNVTRGSGNSILEFAGSGTSTVATVNVGVSGTGTAILNIKDTHNLTAANFSVGEQSSQGGTINQSGGAVTVTGAFRMGHYPTETSFYNLSSGSLSLTGTPAGVVNPSGTAEQNGVLYIGIDGTAEFAMSGGTASANAIVLDGRVANAGTDKLTVTGGVFTIGSNGIKAGSLDLAANIASMQIDLGGGTLAASAPWTSTLPMTLTGTGGDITFNTSGNTIGLSGVLSGSGGLKKAGAGTLALSGSNTYTGVTNITSGTVALSLGGAIADTSVVNLTNSGTVFSISGITNTSETVASLSGISGSSVQLGTKTLDLGSDNTNFEVASDVSGSGGSLKKTGSGMMTLSGTSNTYSGSTDLIGGTLLLGANNVLPNAAALTLSGGTTLNTGGFSDSTGNFTLGNDAVIDMGAGNSILSFTNASAWNGVLSVWNWNGTLRTAGGTDQLIFTGATGLVDLPNVNFYSDAGGTLLGGGGAIFDGTELVPVPEPGAILAALFLLGLIVCQERRRRTS